MKRLAAIVLLMLAGLFSASALQTRGSVDLSVYHGCPMEGDARSQAVQALNRLKNRVTAPTPAQIKQKITLAAILVPGYDVGRWKVKDGATITGYVYDVRPGGIETVNCHARNWADRDTHIELVLDPMDEGAMQRMLFDVEHKNQSENTVPAGSCPDLTKSSRSLLSRPTINSTMLIPSASGAGWHAISCLHRQHCWSIALRPRC